MTAATAVAPPPESTTPSSSTPANAPSDEGGPELEPVERLKRSAKLLVVAAVDLAAGKATEMVEGFSGNLEGLAAGNVEGMLGGLLGGGQGAAGVGMSAALGAAKNWMAGGNPVWGAVKGGWQALGTGTKVMLVLGLVLLGLLSPVALLVALIVLLIVAIVRAAKN